VLVEFLPEPLPLRDRIIRNFAARGMRSLAAIIDLAAADNTHDGWVLHRGLLERLFHLHSLAETQEWELFEEWSFYIQAKAMLNLRSDPELASRVPAGEAQLTPEQSARYKRLQASPPRWRRPKPEDTAKAMNLLFVYKYGYDFASRLVHPLADDGAADFLFLIGQAPARHSESVAVLASNSCLAHILLLQEGMNASTRAWRRAAYGFLDEALKDLQRQSNSYASALERLVQFQLGGGNLSERRIGGPDVAGEVSR
jgi:hypothetical protein